MAEKKSDEAEDLMDCQDRPIRGRGAFVLLLAASLLIFGGLGYGYYHRVQADLLDAEGKQLATVAKTKESQAALWYDAFNLQAEAIRSNPMVVNRVRGLLANPKDPEARQELIDWIGLLQKLHDCRSVALLDVKGNPILTLPEGRTPFSASQEPAFLAALRSRQVAVSDLHLGKADSKAHISFYVPIGGKPGPDSLADGVLRLQVDPYEHLFPLLQQWPTSSPSAEIVLARREGNEVVYLNELRHQKETALKLRIPIDSRVSLPAAMAALGREGIVEGKDYRGVRVLASVGAVAGTPWFLVAKVDLDEMYAALRVQAWGIGLTALALAMATSMGGGLLWRRRDSQRLRRELKAEQERQALADRILHLNRYANDIILLLDAEWGILEANDRAVERYGYTLEELKRLTIRDLRAQDSLSELDSQLDYVRNNPGMVFETKHLNKEGLVFPVEVSSRRIELHGIQYYQSFIRDITERRRADLERETTVQFLGLVNSSETTEDLIHTALRFFQGQSGCEAVGVRLKGGEDYPYFEANGFSEEFVQAESQLCARDAAGELIRDAAGNPVLECMCGNVICGRFDPSKPFFTQHGSFWTNSTTKLLASTSEADRLARTRNRCAGEGYESVALIPLSVGTERLGLLQLNDRRKDCFTPEIIALWERLGGYLAVALAKTETEEELRKSEEKFAKAFHMSPDAVNINRLDDGVCINVNDGFTRIMGYARQEVLGRSSPKDLKIWVNMEDRARLVAGLKEHGEVLGLEADFRRKDGSIVSGMMSAKVLEIDGTPCILSITRDITERKRAEAALRESEQRLSLAQRAGRVGAFDMDIQSGRVLWASELKEILGWSDEAHDAYYKDWAKRVVPEDLARLEALFVEWYSSDREVEEWEYRITHPDGQEHWIAASAQVFRDSAGRAVRMIGTNRDITARKRTEAQLLVYQEQLRGLARRLVTAEEQERRRIAVDFHDQIGQNAASLRLGLQSLRKARLSEEESLVLQESLALLKQMCDDSRTLAFELCSPLLYEIGLGAAISSLAEKIGQQHNVHIHVEGGHLGTALRDDLGAALYQVARELLRNAIRHAKPSNLYVTLSEGCETRIVVRDDGAGFDATHRESSEQRETGFGLFGIRERLRLYGGRLEVQSQPGHGTVATAIVPQGVRN